MYVHFENFMSIAIFLNELFTSTNTGVFVSGIEQPYEDVLSSNSSLCRVTSIIHKSYCNLYKDM